MSGLIGAIAVAVFWTAFVVVLVHTYRQQYPHT